MPDEDKMLRPVASFKPGYNGPLWKDERGIVRPDCPRCHGSVICDCAVKYQNPRPFIGRNWKDSSGNVHLECPRCKKFDYECFCTQTYNNPVPYLGSYQDDLGNIHLECPQCKKFDFDCFCAYGIPKDRDSESVKSKTPEEFGQGQGSGPSTQYHTSGSWNYASVSGAVEEDESGSQGTVQFQHPSMMMPHQLDFERLSSAGPSLQGLRPGQDFPDSGHFIPPRSSYPASQMQEYIWNRMLENLDIEREDKPNRWERKSWREVGTTNWHENCPVCGQLSECHCEHSTEEERDLHPMYEMFFQQIEKEHGYSAAQSVVEKLRRDGKIAQERQDALRRGVPIEQVPDPPSPIPEHLHLPAVGSKPSGEDWSFLNK